MTRLLAALFLALPAPAADPYEEYVKTSPEFRPVKQDAAWALKAFPSWTYMPWTHRWTVGYTPESGRWAAEHGYNGAFIDRDDLSANGSKTSRLDWITQHRLRFYVDHLADKGLLHLWDGDKVKSHFAELHGTGVRPVPLDDAARDKLRQHIRTNVNAVKGSSLRAAYALDDEPSWGHFVHPTMWRVTADETAYPKWLKTVYGPDAPKRGKWIGYDDIRPKLASWSLKEFDASPLLDQWTFNDARWCDFMGGLVEYANELDAATPCGIVGGQAPSPFGGYDYARLMRKVQFIESYDLGSSQSIIRSFNPDNALPAVTTHFHKSVADTVWQAWYYLAHGNKGHIGWVEGWFDGKTPKPWHAEVAPTFKECGQKIGPMLGGARWLHDGVAIYYSHPSIQLGWVLDAEAHGKTWVNRNDDHRLASAGHVRHAWENMLRDSGIQYNFLSYVDVIQKGVPAEYKVLILPACLCLSDAETRRIEEFCRNGGTVIADYMPGLWDQHGKGRPGGGALDAIFGVKHSPDLKARDLFGGKLWVEVDQDRNYGWKTYEEFLTNGNSCVRDPSGFHKAVRDRAVNTSREYGTGRAVLMNLSPQWYNAYRAAGAGPAKKREVFVKHLLDAGVTPRMRIKDAGEAEHGYEVTYWNLPAAKGKPARSVAFLCLNPEIVGTPLGGGNAQGLKTDKLKVTLRFRDPVKGVRDERSGKALGDGQEFTVEWVQNQAVVLSFDRP